MNRLTLFFVLALGIAACGQRVPVDPQLVSSAVDTIEKESYYPIDKAQCRVPLEQFVEARLSGREAKDLRKQVVDAGCLDRHSNIFPLSEGGLSSLDETNVVSSWRGLSIWYVQIFSFTHTAASEFDEALRGRVPGEKIILDLRGNSGGFVTVMTQIAGHFAPHAGAPMFFEVARNGSFPQTHASKRGELADSEVIILVDRKTASAGEMLAGVLRFWNKDKVLLVGERTLGKSSSQTLVGGPKNHRQILLTTTLFAVGQPEHAVHIDRVGLAPDVSLDNPTAENTITFALSHFGIIPKAK